MSDYMDDFDEVGDHCVGVKWVSWEKPRRGAYCYCVIWHKRDPQVRIRCDHRHRKPSEAMKCGKRGIRSGELAIHLD